MSLTNTAYRNQSKLRRGQRTQSSYLYQISENGDTQNSDQQRDSSLSQTRTSMESQQPQEQLENDSMIIEHAEMDKGETHESREIKHLTSFNHLQSDIYESRLVNLTSSLNDKDGGLNDEIPFGINPSYNYHFYNPNTFEDEGEIVGILPPKTRGPNAVTQVIKPNQILDQEENFYSEFDADMESQPQFDQNMNRYESYQFGMPIEENFIQNECGSTPIFMQQMSSGSFLERVEQVQGIVSTNGTQISNRVDINLPESDQILAQVSQFSKNTRIYDSYSGLLSQKRENIDFEGSGSNDFMFTLYNYQPYYPTPISNGVTSIGVEPSLREIHDEQRQQDCSPQAAVEHYQTDFNYQEAELGEHILNFGKKDFQLNKSFESLNFDNQVDTHKDGAQFSEEDNCNYDFMNGDSPMFNGMQLPGTPSGYPFPIYSQNFFDDENHEIFDRVQEADLKLLEKNSDNQLESQIVLTKTPDQNIFGNINAESTTNNDAILLTMTNERKISQTTGISEVTKKGDVVQDIEEQQPQQKIIENHHSQLLLDDYETPGGPTPGGPEEEVKKNDLKTPQPLNNVPQNTPTGAQLNPSNPNQNVEIQEVQEQVQPENQNQIVDIQHQNVVKSELQSFIKRRGAPFKGPVSNNNAEKFKPYRQKSFRVFKQFYERRIMPGIGIALPKRKKHKDGQINEQEQRKLSKNDAFNLLGSEVFSQVSAEVSLQLQN